MDFMLEEKLIQEHLCALELMWEEATIVLPRDYLEQIARHWFESIAPAKTMEYGVTAWQRLGAKGIVAQLSGCYYRWIRLVKRGSVVSDPSMFNAVVDSFGYSMLLLRVLEVHMDFDDSPILVGADHEWLIEKIWDLIYSPISKESPISVRMAASTIAIRMAYNMWKGAIDRG